MTTKDKLKILLKEVFFEYWMDENDWEEFQQELFSETGLSYEGMEIEIQKGISNGYSEEFQLKVMKDLLNSSK